MSPADPDRLMTSADVAAMLGLAPGNGPATVADYARRRGLPFIDMPGRMLFRRSDVLEWIEGRRKVQAASEKKSVKKRPTLTIAAAKQRRPAWDGRMR